MINKELKKLNIILDNLNIKKGENIYLGVDFMKLVSTFKLHKYNNEKIANSILNSILKRIGKKGNLTIPVFNFDTVKTGFFNIQKTPGQSGAFGNLLLKKHYKKRSKHPLYSFLFFGKKNKEFIKKEYQNAVGPDSHWSDFIKNNFKILSIGFHYNRSLTITHYFENKIGVNYRYNKSFTVKSIDINKKIKKKIYSFYARKINICKFSAITLDCERRLSRKKISKFYRYKKLISFKLNIKEASKEILNNFKKSISYVPLKKKNNKVLDSKNTLKIEEFYLKK
jgi:aminoglycoside 3-N-acetyltransferase